MVSIFSRLVEAEEVEMTIGCHLSSRRAHGAVGGVVGMNSGTFYRHLPSLFASQADAILRLNAAFIQKYMGLRLPLCQNEGDSFYRVVASFLQLVRL